MTDLHANVDQARLTTLLERVRGWWDLRYRMPIPGTVSCPVCGAAGVRVLGQGGELIYRSCQFHVRIDSPTRYRADVGLKCSRCSHLIRFAPVITREMFDWGHDRVWDHRSIESALSEGIVYADG